MSKDNLVDTKERIHTKGQLFDLVRRNGLLTELEENMREHQFTVKKLQKIWNERSVREGGR